MAFIWIDKKDGEDLILASDINGIAKELINVGKDSAKKDLSNVDNETFKAKAEEAGLTTNGSSENITIDFDDIVPDKAVTSICDFTFTPKTQTAGYWLMNTNLLPSKNGKFAGKEIPLLTTVGELQVQDSEGKIKYKKDIDSLINYVGVSDSITQDGVEKKWSNKFYITKSYTSYEQVGTNYIYYIDFDESEFENTGLPKKPINSNNDPSNASTLEIIPIATPCFYTDTKAKNMLNGRIYNGTPNPAIFYWDSIKSKYVLKFRTTFATDMIRHCLTNYSKTYFYYQLETPYSVADYFALGLAPGDSVKFEEKTEIYDEYLQANEFLWQYYPEQIVTVAQVTPSIEIEVPTSLVNAVEGFDQAARMLNNGSSGTAVAKSQWIGNGDGTTDYTNKIQSKIDEYHNLGGGDIYLGEGTYIISSSLILYDNISLIGEGKKTVIKMVADNTHAVVISGSYINVKNLAIQLAGACNNGYTACLYINSNNMPTVNLYDSNYPDNLYCQHNNFSDLYLSGTYSFDYVNGHYVISDDYDNYFGCGIISGRLFFNYANVSNVTLAGFCYGIYGLGGSNNFTIYCTNTKTMVGGGGGYATIKIFGHSYYGEDANGNTISMSDTVGDFDQLEQSTIEEYVYDIQWMKHIYKFGGYSINNRYIISQVGGASYVSNESEDSGRLLKTYVVDLGRGNRQIETFQNRPFHVGNVYHDLTGQTSFKNVDPLIQNVMSGAGVWGNGITSNTTFTGSLPLSEICRYPKQFPENSTSLTSAISSTAPSVESPIDIIIDISNSPIRGFISCFIQFDPEYIASDFTVSFDSNNDGNYDYSITATNNQDVTYYFFGHQNAYIRIYKIKISITKALHIHELKYQNSAYNKYTKDYNHDELVGICNFGVVSSGYNGRSFLPECGGNIYGDVVLNKNSTIKNVPYPIENNDAVNKRYVDEKMASNAMVFKGVVDALPETANEGEVYKLHKIDAEPIIRAFDTWGVMRIYNDRIDFGGDAIDVYEDIANRINNAGGMPLKFQIEIFDQGLMLYIDATKAENGVIYGTTTATETVEANGMIQIAQRTEISKTVVYHNGEWVEL